MRIIISDTNALIHLRKGILLDALLQLPHVIQVPDLLFEDELLSIPANEKRALRHQGLQVVPLASAVIDRALELERGNPVLRLYDCAAVALAEETPDCILLTGDGQLRIFAQRQAIEVRGVLWAFDQIQHHHAASSARLRTALTTWMEDTAVWLPESELSARFRRLTRTR